MKYRVIERIRDKYSVKAMCELFEVSRRGYYALRNRQGKPNKDQWLVDLISEAQRINKQTYGYRRMHRWLNDVKHKKVNIKSATI